MIRITERPPKACTRDDIAAFESRIGRPLPRDYAAFLLETNGGYCGIADDDTASVFDFTVPSGRGENGELAVMHSLGLGDTRGTLFGDLAVETETCRTCEFPMPPGMVAIGETFGGAWVITLGIANRFRDGVYILIEGHGYRWGDILVATSFTAFNRMVRQEKI